MAKISTNMDKINTDLIPTANQELSDIKNAQSIANSVSFPDGSIDWGSVTSKIDDCVDKAEKYTKWVSSIQSDYKKVYEEGVENLASNKIEEVPRSSIIVK